ncbi:hypothetical protein SDC9_130434 [bioreactor metagenome]|uniref:Phosphodiester glycosidase domain-containing protein n=1 Tax=bioreactor metagenome TaxID=1076179 RepID=A0A645D1N1_9ZZZZ
MYIRSDKSTNPVYYSILNTGESITRIAIYSDGWSGVLYNDKECYILSKNLTTEKISNGHWEYAREGLSINIDKVVENGIVYFVAQVYTANPGDDINTMLAGGSYSKCFNTKEKTSTMANKADAIFAVNGDAVGFRPSGRYRNPIVIRNGQILYDKNSLLCEMTAITDDGRMLFFREGVDNITAQQMIDMGVTDLFWFEGAVVRNGVDVYGDNLFTWKNPQTAFGQKDPNNWIFIVVDGRGSNGSRGVCYAGMADLMIKYGAVNAGLLDGGGSTEMWFNGMVLNKPSDGGERSLSDIVYIKK